MVEIRRTDAYDRWFRRLRDRNAREIVNIRIRRLREGSAGDVRAVGEGVSELRIPYGPGYRIYFTRLGQRLIMLLAGGDKDGQERDIRMAQSPARGVRRTEGR